MSTGIEYLGLGCPDSRNGFCYSVGFSRGQIDKLCDGDGPDWDIIDFENFVDFLLDVGAFDADVDLDSGVFAVWFAIRRPVSRSDVDALFVKTFNKFIDYRSEGA